MVCSKNRAGKVHFGARFFHRIYHATKGISAPCGIFLTPQGTVRLYANYLGCRCYVPSQIAWQLNVAENKKRYNKNIGHRSDYQ